MLILLYGYTHAQIKQPVFWHVETTSLSAKEVTLTFTALINEPWHLYAVYMQEGGPMPTRFEFQKSPDYTPIGNIKELSKPVESFDPTFLMPVAWFSKSAVFTQRFKLNATHSTIKATVEFMACTDQECLLPETKSFLVEVNTQPNLKPKTDSKRNGTQKTSYHADQQNE